MVRQGKQFLEPETWGGGAGEEGLSEPLVFLPLEPCQGRFCFCDSELCAEVDLGGLSPSRGRTPPLMWQEEEARGSLSPLRVALTPAWPSPPPVTSCPEDAPACARPSPRSFPHKWREMRLEEGLRGGRTQGGARPGQTLQGLASHTEPAALHPWRVHARTRARVRMHTRGWPWVPVATLAHPVGWVPPASAPRQLPCTRGGRSHCRILGSPRRPLGGDGSGGLSGVCRGAGVTVRPMEGCAQSGPLEQDGAQPGGASPPTPPSPAGAVVQETSLTWARAPRAAQVSSREAWSWCRLPMCGLCRAPPTQPLCPVAFVAPGASFH